MTLNCPSGNEWSESRVVWTLGTIKPLMIMKQYNIELAKKVIATFRMNYDEMKMKFEIASAMATWIVGQHPELKDCARHTLFEGGYVYLEFYSIGEPVIVEEA